MSMAHEPSGSRRGMSQVCRVFALIAGLWLTGGLLLPARAEDRLILRDTRTIAGNRITAFDEDGVRVEGMPQAIGWDEIGSGTFARDQPRFDRLLKDLGDHLYRIRLRLRSGDDRDVLPHAE